MDTQQLLSLPVSWQSQIWLPIEKEITIYAVLNKIQSGELEAEIDQIRHFQSAGDLESFTMYKRGLPAVTFCGRFDHQRKRETLKAYNYILVLDIDKLNEKELEETAGVLEQDPYVFSYWLSPSGKGYKGLVALEYEFQVKKEAIAASHKKAFQKLARYFFDNYKLELDESGCDITRLCFLSSDPDLVIKQHTQPFMVDQLDLREWPKAGNAQQPFVISEDKRLLQFKNKAEEKALVEAVIRFLQESAKSITASYEQWYRIAYALSEAFTFKVGLAYYLRLCAMDGTRFDEPACRAMFYYCYKNADGRIKLNSLLFYAGKLGFRQDGQSPLKLNEDESENTA